MAPATKATIRYPKKSPVKFTPTADDKLPYLITYGKADGDVDLKLFNVTAGKEVAPGMTKILTVAPPDWKVLWMMIPWPAVDNEYQVKVFKKGTSTLLKESIKFKFEPRRKFAGTIEFDYPLGGIDTVCPGFSAYGRTDTVGQTYCDGVDTVNSLAYHVHASVDGPPIWVADFTSVTNTTALDLYVTKLGTAGPPIQVPNKGVVVDSTQPECGAS
jgi:hypothetical protein